jgi:hypothetical protein
MRQVAVSVALFAKIWALRKPGEETEDAILTRLLSEGPAEKLENYSGAEPAQGFRDLRHNVSFPEGFEIFRRLKGRDVKARAVGGVWLCAGQRYVSLNALSRGVGAGAENAWVSWFFLDDKARRQQIATLRDPAAVARRAKPVTSEMGSAASDEAAWLRDVRAGLGAIEESRGLLAHIYKAVEIIRRGAGRDWPASAEATIRRTLAEHSSDSDSFTGKADLFAMPYGKGAEFWALR